MLGHLSMRERLSYYPLLQVLHGLWSWVGTSNSCLRKRQVMAKD